MTLTLAILSGGRQYVLDGLALHPTWQRTRLKSAEGAASILVEIAKTTVLDEAAALILPDIQHWYGQYVRTNGQRPAEPSDWDEGHDDGLLELFEPYVSVLSASWLAFTSTDARLWVDGEDEKLARSFGNEVWKQLSWSRTNNQILAGVGIVSDDLAQYGVLPPEPIVPTKPEFNPMRVNAVLNRIMMLMPDEKTLADELDLASDDDILLRTGAAQRLGISAEDAEILCEARQLSPAAPEAWKNAIDLGEMLDESVNYVDLSGEPDDQADNASAAPDAGPELSTSLRRLPPLPGSPTNASAGTMLPPLPVPRAMPPLPPPPVATGTSTAPPPPARGGRRTKTPDKAPAGAIDVAVLRSIKDHAGVKDEDMADMMGISRPTLANIMKGKAWYVPPDPSRRQAILNMLVRHANALNEAYHAVNV